MAARRKFYKLQAHEIGELLRRESFGHFMVIGPREDDGEVLIVRYTPASTQSWVMSPTGELRQPVISRDDPLGFGAVTGTRHV